MSVPEQPVLLDRARAHVHTQDRAIMPDRSVDLSEAEILSKSEWQHHKLESGWLYMQAYMQMRQKLARKSDLVQRARNIWQEVASCARAKPAELLHAEMALTSTPLWVRHKTGNELWTPRAVERQAAQIRKLETHASDAIYRSFRGEIPKTSGFVAEVICFDLLNRLALNGEREDMLVLPAQSWHDTGHDTRENFDFWQIENGKSRKIQVKSSNKTTKQQRRVAEHLYSDDIAIVYLSEHWPGNPADIAHYLSTSPVDEEGVLVAARSMQKSIDDFFATRT